MHSDHRREPFAVVNFAEMVMSRLPSGAAPSGVTPLQEVWVGVRAYGVHAALKADLDPVLEQ